MGRPETISVDLGIGIMEKLEGLVRRTGKTKSEIIREAVVAYDYHSLHTWQGMANLIEEMTEGEAA